MNRFLNRKILSDRSGFTLIELMVVVAIIGILAAIGLPQYQTYRRQAYSSEAKVMLGSAKAAQSSFAFDQLSFTGCAWDIGVQPENTTQNLYAVGFQMGDDAAMQCGLDGGQSCNLLAYNPNPVGTANCGADQEGIASMSGSHYAASRQLPTAMGLATQLQLASAQTDVMNNSYTIGAAADLGRGGAAAASEWDVWGIDQNGALVHYVSGF